MHKLYQDNDSYLVFRIFDRDNPTVQYDVSNLSEVHLTLSECGCSEQAPVIHLTLGEQLTTQDGTHIAAKFTREDTVNLQGTYHLQLDIFDQNGDKSTVFQGHIYFLSVTDKGDPQ